MAPTFASIVPVVEALIYHPHSSAKRLLSVIGKDPNRYGPAPHIDTVHGVLNWLRELNLVRVHFDDRGALYEFGNQPHPVFVCLTCDRERARQDVLFTTPSGPFIQPAKGKDGRVKQENIPLLQLIEFNDFVPLTYRFEVIGYCRAHVPQKLLQAKTADFLAFLVAPEELQPEFKVRWAVHDERLILESLALTKQLAEAPRIGSVVSRIIDKPSQFLAEFMDKQLEHLDSDMLYLQQRRIDSSGIDFVGQMLEKLYVRAAQRRIDELKRMDAARNDGDDGAELFRQAVEGSPSSS